MLTVRKAKEIDPVPLGSDPDLSVLHGNVETALGEQAPLEIDRALSALGARVVCATEAAPLVPQLVERSVA